MKPSSNDRAKLKRSDKALSNTLIDNLLKTGVFKSAAKEELSSEVKQLLEDF